ncbi:hypothetical protein Bca101_032406 [Brassica carinata]
MAMRDLVNGGAACAVPGSSSSSSNPLGALTNALLGSSSKTQERLREIPNATRSGPGPQFYSQDQHLSSLPGSELDQPLLQPGAQGAEFFRGFSSVEQNALGAAWDEVQRGGPMPPMGPMYEPVHPTFEGPPQRVLSNFLHSFVESSRGGIPFRPAPVPVLGLSHLLLSVSLDELIVICCFIALTKPGLHPADGWAAEFNQHGMDHGGPDGWVQSFEQQHGVNGWATEFGQNSKFLQFVSKMSRGELIIDENQVKPGSAPGEWATEYEQQYLGPPSWADQFANEKLSHGPEQWADEFASGRGQQESAEDQWVNEFSKLNVDDWVDEFAEGPLGESSADAWANAYDEFLTERNAEKQASGVYVFSDMNPYVGHPDPMKEGQELFRKGLLSEAALALEAEVMKILRMLKAIAAMMRAHEADPSNLEVLLALGVSHTNELEQATALKYLYGWLRNHPKFGAIAPPELADSLYHADIARLFTEASQMNPEDADVHIALDLKPNYVRAWANMGISYANQGLYQESIPYYVRALSMNPKADTAWQYLRISLSCASRQDMIEACESRNLDLLQKEFPL